MKFAKLKQLEFANSKKLPRYIKFIVNGKMYYREWVGMGWIESNPDEGYKYIEIVD